MRKPFLMLLLALAVCAMAAPQALARTPIAVMENNVAISGYDPVAYFDAGEAIEGKAGVESRWAGAVWRFSSEENRKKFEANPEKYAPQYGGYCVISVAEGSPAAGDPEVWTIREDKLYLCSNDTAQKKFAKDPAGTAQKADKNYPAVFDKK